MDNEPNPYEPPLDASTDESALSPPTEINFSGGLLSPLGIGAVGATIESLLIAVSDHLTRQFDAILMVLMPLVWCSSFAWVAYLSTWYGRSTQKTDGDRIFGRFSRLGFVCPRLRIGFRGDRIGCHLQQQPTVDDAGHPGRICQHPVSFCFAC